ncbi:hypothetical protein STPH2_1625 [Streptomyces sp. KO7888]|nr:hypothetical protein [Streptomyces sp. KO7888]
MPSPGATSRSRIRRARPAWGGGEFAVHLLGGADDGAAQPSGRLVAGDGQGAAGAVPPGLQQRVGHQRQPARRVRDLVQQPGGQGAFDDE